MSPVHLEIYVDGMCWASARARRLAGEVQVAFPGVDVHVIEAASGRGVYRSLIAATPTFVLNGRLWSLGNPALDDLTATVAALLEEVCP